MTDTESSLLKIFRTRWIIGALVIVAVALGVWRMTTPAQLRTVTIERRDIVETLAVVGRVRPPSRATLGASIAGTVTEVRVREGDRISRGDVLLRLEDREAAAAVRQAEAALTETEAAAGHAVAEAEREAAQAARDLERIRAVVEEGGFNPQRMEQAEQRAADAASRLASLRATMDSTGEPATVTRARATLEAARARLALTRITAPADGIVLTRSVEPGDALSPGRIVMEVAFEGATELVVFPGEENLGRLHLGAAAVASADAFPDQTFPAMLALIAPSVDASQGTVELRLSIPDPPAYLLPDMTVSVNIETGRKEGASVLPEDAVQGLGTSQPWVGVIRDGELARLDVSVGLRAVGYVEITAGLEPETRVALDVTGDDIGSSVRAADDETGAPRS
jgi:HlyD family secretion protein